MADLKISQLTGATTPLAGTEVLPIVQSSATKKVAVSDLTAGRAVSAATVATTGNAAVGTSLVAWNANYTALDVGGVVGITSYLYTDLWYNSYINAGGTTVYKNGGYSASRLRQDNGTLKFSSTGSTTGTAGGTATLTDFFTVDVNGNYIPNQAGKGVNFTANTPAAGMTSQLLNWYEEGTFTPTINTTNNDFSGSSNSLGLYTRIGKVVYFSLYVESYSVSSVGTGNVVIEGLPFVSNNTLSQRYNVFCWEWIGTTTQPSAGVLLPNSTRIELLTYASGSVYAEQLTAVPASALSTTSFRNDVQITGFYFV